MDLKSNCFTKHLWFFLGFYVSFLTESLINAQVNVEPTTSLLNEGDKTDFLCRYGHSINYCRIEIPGEKILNLSPDWSKTPGFTYFGSGFAAGQCGVSIEHIKAKNNGQVKCSLGVEGEEFSGTMDLIVALRPQQPIIKPLTQPDHEGYFTERSQFQARCIVKDGRPAANITWFLDDLPANKRTSNLEVIASPTDNVLLSTTIQEIQWQLGPEDNGRKLICRSHHQTDKENVPPQEGAYLLLVHYAPLQIADNIVYGLYLDQTAIVNITLRSNPFPTVEWTVDGVVIQQGSQNGRFSAYEPKNIGHDYYNVSLAIAGLTSEDTMKSYQLRASNALGFTDYDIHISSSNKPPSAGLDIAAIIGIAVAVTFFCVIILIVLFARVTKRWCFSGATLNTDIGPDSEAQINPHHNDDFDRGESINDEETDNSPELESTTLPATKKQEVWNKDDNKNGNGKLTISQEESRKNNNSNQNEPQPKTNTSV